MLVEMAVTRRLGRLLWATPGLAGPVEEQQRATSKSPAGLVGPLPLVNYNSRVSEVVMGMWTVAPLLLLAMVDLALMVVVATVGLGWVRPLLEERQHRGVAAAAALRRATQRQLVQAGQAAQASSSWSCMPDLSQMKKRYEEWPRQKRMDEAVKLCVHGGM
jgi:hypothetical protein